MLTYETIKKLCKDHGVTVTGVEKELGFSRGSLCKVNTNKPSMEKVQKLASYFNISVESLLGDEEDGPGYYLNEETAKAAQEIFENNATDLKALHSMALALKRKERGYIDDTGC